MTLVRRLRGALGSAAVWAVAFGAVGVLFVAVELARGLLPPPEAEPLLPFAGRVVLRAARLGAMTGAAFAVTVMLAERRRSVDALSGRRLALWGFLAGALLPLAVNAGYHLVTATPLDAGMLPWAAAYGVIGAGIAAATHRLARRHALPTGGSPAGVIGAGIDERLPESWPFPSAQREAIGRQGG